MRTNRLLHAPAGVAAAYCVAGIVAPGPVTSALSAVLLLIGSGLVFFRYAPPAWAVVVRKMRSDEAGGEGAHLALYGMALIGAGLTWAAIYSVLWLLWDRPDHWQNTAWGPFGRFMAAWGLILVFFSPDMATPSKLRPSKWTIGVIVAVLAVVAALFLGIQIGKSASLSEIPPEFRLGRVAVQR